MIEIAYSPIDPYHIIEANNRGTIKFFTYVVSVVGTTATIDPQLPDSFTGAVVKQSKYRTVSYVGIEDMEIVGKMGGSSAQFAQIQFDNSYACWVKNVRCRESGNYAVIFNWGIRPSIAHSHIDGNGPPNESNHSGILFNPATGPHLYDSIIERSFPNVESFSGGITYGVIEGCLLMNSPGGKAILWHNAYPQYNLIEGNLIWDVFQQDGYFSGAYRDVIYRNWFCGMSGGPPRGITATASNDTITATAHGVTTGFLIRITVSSGFGGVTTGAYYTIKVDEDHLKLATTYENAIAGTAIDITSDGSGVLRGYESSLIALNRFTREFVVIGNIKGSPAPFSYSTTRLSMGNPAIGNSNSTGTSTFYGARSVLSSRIGPTQGVVTAPSGHGVTTGTTNVYWQDIEGGYKVEMIRRGVTVSVSGDLLTISGGTGDDLPAASSEVFVPTTNDALRAFPIDWDSTLNRPRTYDGTFSNRTGNRTGTVTIDLASRPAVTSHLTGTDRFSIAIDGVNFDVLTVNSYNEGTGAMVFTLDSLDKVLPTVGGDVSMTNSYGGFQERDLDVISTTEIYFNFGYDTGTIPAVEALPGGATLKPSMHRTVKPAYAGELNWPFVNPENPPTTVTTDVMSDMLPAAWRYWRRNESYFSPATPPGAPIYQAGNRRPLRKR